MAHTETYIDGVWYPSVTTIIASKPRPYLDTWRAKWGVWADRKTRAAGSIGTDFHNCVELWLDGKEFAPKYARVHGMMRSFMGWATDVNGEIHQTELKVVSRAFGYSGTLDAVGTFEGEPMLFDYKSSGKIYPDRGLQLVGYAQAYQEEFGVRLAKGMIVDVDKKRPKHRVRTRVFDLNVDLFQEFHELLVKFKEGEHEAKPDVGAEAGC